MYALRDASGQFVARARSKAAAYRKSRTRRAFGASVNRAEASSSGGLFAVNEVIDAIREAGLEYLSVSTYVGQTSEKPGRIDAWTKLHNGRHVESFRLRSIRGRDMYEGEHGPVSRLAMRRRLEGADANRAGEVSKDSLFSMAREAGRAGQNWNDWVMSDEVQDLIMAMHPFSRRDQDAIEAAFKEGYRQHKLAGGWRTLWTTAPVDYDTFGTETLEEGGEWRGKTLRRVLIDPHHLDYQTSRYASGLHGNWDEDPRVEDARWQAQHEQIRVEREAHEAKRQAGLEWLKTATEAELQPHLVRRTLVDLEDEDALHERGLRHSDAREEWKRRAKLAEETTRLAEWERSSALVPEGVTLLDHGVPSRRDQFGWSRAVPPHVYYNVRIVRGWPDDADHANVTGDGNDVAGSLLLVADWITSGRMEIVSPDAVPPRPVVQRIGHEHVKDILRVDVAGRSVWVGSPTFGKQMVLDEKGHVVRAKKVLAAVRGGQM